MSHIPHPDALAAADIILPDLAHPLDRSLLVGTGDLNALVYADGADLVIHLTKNDVWDARLDTGDDLPLMTHRELVRRVEQLSRAADLPADRDMSARIQPDPPGGDSYHRYSHPCPRLAGILRIRGAAGAGPWRLSLARATAERPGLAVFAAAGRDVLVVERTDGPLEMILDPADDPEMPPATVARDGDFLTLARTIPGDRDIVPLHVAVAIDAGRAHEGIAVVAISTAKGTEPYGGADGVVRFAKSRAQSARAEGITALRQLHETWWADFWAKSGIRLADKELSDVWYRNLYFLACVSRPGAAAPGLFAGLTTNRPAWHGDYHTNYNIQQTFWGAWSANHPELAEPYMALVAGYLPRAEWLAGRIYELPGAFYPHVLFAGEPADPAACTSRNGRQYFHFVWGRTLGVTAFTAQPLWWHWQYTMDRRFLVEVAWPVIRETARFYGEFLRRTREETGTAALAPTVSPEHWGITPGFGRNGNCAFDIALAAFLLRAAILACELAGGDPALIDAWRDALAALPPYPTHGAGDDRVLVDVDGAPPIEYNIPVPATPVFPGEEVSAFSGAEERTLAARSIDRMRTNGNNSFVMEAIARARLSMPETAAFVRDEARARMRPNGVLVMNRLATGNRFNDFGHYTEMFGVAMAVAELLLQSTGGVIRLFPAWDREKDAAFTDLRAVGAFLVSAALDGGRLVRCEVASTAGGELWFLDEWGIRRVVDDEGREVRTVAAGDRLIHILTEPGGRYRFETGEVSGEE